MKEVVALIRQERPELAHRLPTAEPPMQFIAPLDLSLTERLMPSMEYIPWEETILQSLDEGLKLEKKLSGKV